MRCLLHTIAVFTIGTPFVIVDGIRRVASGQTFLPPYDPSKPVGWLICPEDIEDCADCNKQQQQTVAHEVVPMQTNTTAVMMSSAAMTFSGAAITIGLTADIALAIVVGAFTGAIGGFIAATVTARPVEQKEAPAEEFTGIAVHDWPVRQPTERTTKRVQ